VLNQGLQKPQERCLAKSGPSCSPLDWEEPENSSPLDWEEPENSRLLISFKDI